jgi:hypothetical protein
MYTLRAKLSIFCVKSKEVYSYRCALRGYGDDVKKDQMGNCKFI